MGSVGGGSGIGFGGGNGGGIGSGGGSGVGGSGVGGSGIGITADLFIEEERMSAEFSISCVASSCWLSTYLPGSVSD
jgi:hypothetical protein